MAEVRLRIPSTPTVETYDIAGTDLDALNDALNRHGFWGRYRSRPAATPRGDPVTRIDLVARPLIILPRWTNRRAAPRDVQDEYDRMLAVLTRHENHHHEIFQNAASAFKREIEDYGDPLPRREFQRRWTRFLRDTQDEQDRYDSATRHGQTEGVALNDP